MPIAYAIQGSDKTTSTMVNTVSGFFMLSFLPKGSYTVAIEDATGKSFTQDNVMVDAGENNDIGEVTLQ